MDSEDIVKFIRGKSDDLECANAEIKQLRQRVAELESLTGQDLVSLNDELTRKYQKHAGDKYELQDKLAATQAHNLRLRSALEVATSICWSNFSEAQEVILTEALREPTDTEALEKYVLERLGEPVAEIVDSWHIFYVGSYSIKHFVGKHGLKIGSKLYALKDKS